MNTRNSRNSPLLIAEVAFAAGEGCVGLTLCPGKKDAGRGWDRDLADDLKVIQDWGAATVVTLLEDHEFALLGVDRLGRHVQALGIDWMHLPVRDVDVPDARFESAWALAGPLLHARIDAGERVLVHCRGGLGRSGLVAGRLLVERGCDPRVAIHRVRAARPGAIETSAQERHVAAARPVSPDRWHERVVASLLAGAVGDAAGYLVEFDDIEAIRRQHGPGGLTLGQIFLVPLAVSDDTQMSLFTLEGIRAALAAGDDSPPAVEAAIREAYRDWFGTQMRSARAPVGRLALDPLLRVRRAPGNTCLGAMARGGGHWDDLPARPLNASKGCGTVMRTAPIGWFRRWSPAEAFAIGMRASAITHMHPTGYVAGGVVPAIVRAVLGGASLKAAARQAGEIAAAVDGAGETIAALEAALELAHSAATPGPESVARLGEGWVAEEALAIALYAALRGETMGRTLEIAINHSGDSDSTASIAGQLRGAAEGLRGIPYGLLRRIDVIDRLLAMGAAGAWD